MVLDSGRFGRSFPRSHVPPLRAGIRYTAAAVGIGHILLTCSDGSAVAVGDERMGRTTVPELPPGVHYTVPSAP